jgi:hypothetical protein
VDSQQVWFCIEALKGLTTRDDSICRSMAQCLKNSPFFNSLSIFENSFFSRHFRGIATQAIRFRISRHLLRPDLPKKNSAKEVIEFVTVDDASSLSQFYRKLELVWSLVPTQSCRAIPAKIQSRSNQISVRVLLNQIDNDLFVQGQPVWIPRSDCESPEALAAFSGFGRHLAWLWRAGKAPVLPISRVVIRFAFGGRLRADDASDVGSKVGDVERWIEPIAKQLRAIRRGVMLFGIEKVKDDDIWPRVFQLMPFEGTRTLGDVSPLLIPLVRKEMWDRRIAFEVDKEEKHRRVAQIVAELSI